MSPQVNQETEVELQLEVVRMCGETTSETESRSPIAILSQ